MQVNKIFLMGEPNSGKTSYIALALGYLLKISGLNPEYVIKPMNGSGSVDTKTYAIDVPEAMKEGAWPDKTGTSPIPVHVLVNHPPTIAALGPTAEELKETPSPSVSSDFWRWLGWAVTLGNCCNNPGERTIHITDCTGESFDGTLGAEEQKKATDACMDADYFLFFFDTQKLLNNDEKTKRVLDYCNDLLEQRCMKLQKDKEEEKKKRLPNRIRLAIVFTKCDVAETYHPSNRPNRPWDDPAIIRDFRSRYNNRLTALAYMSSKGVLDFQYFCVSCLPNPSHRRVDKRRGIVANADWDLDDMKEQMGPLRWISLGFPVA